MNWIQREKLLYPIFGLWGPEGAIIKRLSTFWTTDKHFWCCGPGGNFIYHVRRRVVELVYGVW